MQAPVSQQNHDQLHAQVFLCADLWKDAKVLRAAYGDGQGVTEAFIKNGLAHALRTLGLSQEGPDIDAWPYHVVVNDELQQVLPWPAACTHRGPAWQLPSAFHGSM